MRALRGTENQISSPLKILFSLKAATEEKGADFMKAPRIFGRQGRTRFPPLAPT